MSNKKATKTRLPQLHLDMQLRNFGPIKKASIAIRPLTIFVGPSNTGKSYTAMLAHSIISSSGNTGVRHYPLIDPRDKINELEKLLRDIKATLADFKPNEPTDCPPALAAKIKQSCKRNFAKKVQNEIARNFGSSLNNLARFKSSRFFMSMKNDGDRMLTCSSSGVNLNFLIDPNIRFELRKTTRYDPGYVNLLNDGTLNCIVHRELLNDDDLTGLRIIYDELEREMLLNATFMLPSTSLYFPAGRTGILQAHRVISSGIIRSAPYGGIENIRIPRLSGVVSDFVSYIIEMRPHLGQYNNLGKQIEKDIFNGFVNLKPSVGNTAPDIIYRHRLGLNAPMHMSSSAISELAPLTLYLKHSGRLGDMFVIEEPEAHLHPHSQRLLAMHLVRLVKNGINVMITTHSAIVLEVVSQCLQANKMAPRDRKRVLGDENLHLGMDEVAPHLFSLDKNYAATVKKIPMSIDEGISQEEFIAVDRLLNIDNIRIEESIN